MEQRKVLLSARDLEVKFRVRGRVLSAIRKTSLDIYENESIAIVGESGSGKSVFTKTFAGMLESNGYVSGGHLYFDDDTLSDVHVPLNDKALAKIATIKEKLDEFSLYESGAEVYRQILELKAEKRSRLTVSDEERNAQESAIKDLQFRRTELYNRRMNLDRNSHKEELKQIQKDISDLDDQIKAAEKQFAKLQKTTKKSASHDAAYQEEYTRRKQELKDKYSTMISETITQEVSDRNAVLAKEIYMSSNPADTLRSGKTLAKLLEAFEEAMKQGIDWDDDRQHREVYTGITAMVQFVEQTETELVGRRYVDLAYIQSPKEWMQIRGKRIATVFQDPMTSLNPTITIGKQISSVIIKHQKCSEVEARAKALELMQKVGIPNPVARYDDYPFQYSGGMRQRIVIAIALSCQPQLLICDEPTTALDVTIQAQILKLIKDLQREFNYTIVFITHDLGVVANVADRVAVMYAGQIVELGTVEDVFYDPRHPYTWALLSSLPQLAEKNTELFSINGTPPSLYNSITGDAFAPRNPYCMKIDTLLEPPMIQVSPTHSAKTWLLDPDAPKVEKPKIIRNLHERLLEAYNIQEV